MISCLFMEMPWTQTADPLSWGCITVLFSYGSRDLTWNNMLSRCSGARRNGSGLKAKAPLWDIHRPTLGHKGWVDGLSPGFNQSREVRWTKPITHFVFANTQSKTWGSGWWNRGLKKLTDPGAGRWWHGPYAKQLEWWDAAIRLFPSTLSLSSHKGLYVKRTVSWTNQKSWVELFRFMFFPTSMQELYCSYLFKLESLSIEWIVRLHLLSLVRSELVDGHWESIGRIH